MSFIEKKDYLICVKNLPIFTTDIIVVNRKKQILLLKRNNKPALGTYYTPGGRVFKNEPMVRSTRRKLKEELGIIASERELTFAGVIDEIFPDSTFPETNVHTVNAFFVYKIKNDRDIKLDSQHCDYKWLTLAEAVRDRKVHKYARQKIKMAEKYI